MLRTALLWGNSITLDADMSKYIETLSDQWVIEGLEVSSGSVAPGKAWVKATRSNGETIMVLVQNTQAQSISLNWDVFVGIEIDQNAINNWALNNEDGTGIASIKVSPSKPSQNYLLLASVNNGRVEDARAMIPKIQSVAQRTTSLEQKMETAENNISVLQDKGTPQYLGKWCVVGETYQSWDVMVEHWGKLIKEIYKQQVNGVSGVFINLRWGFHDMGNISVPQGSYIRVKIKQYYNSGNSREWGTLKIWTSSRSGDIGWVSFSPQRRDAEFDYLMEWKNEIYFCIEWWANNITANIASIEVEVNANRWLPRLYPREVKRPEERVECTLYGLHSDWMLIQPRLTEVEVGKEMAGTFTGSRTAPADGHLEINYKMGTRDAQYGRITVNGNRLELSEHNRTARIFVKKWTIEIRGWGREGYAVNTRLKLDKFISVL